MLTLIDFAQPKKLDGDPAQASRAKTIGRFAISYFVISLTMLIALVGGDAVSETFNAGAFIPSTACLTFLGLGLILLSRWGYSQFVAYTLVVLMASGIVAGIFGRPDTAALSSAWFSVVFIMAAFTVGLKGIWMVSAVCVVITTIYMVTHVGYQGQLVLMMTQFLAFGMCSFVAAYSRDEELKELTREWQLTDLLFKSLPDAATLRGNDGRYRKVSDTFCELLGRTRQQILACDPEQLMAGFSAENPEVLSVLNKRFEDYSSEVHTFRFSAQKDGLTKEFLVSRCSLMAGKERVGVLTISRDITELVAIQKELVEQKTSAMESAQLASIGEMAAGIAHEINNPLAVAIGYTKKLNKELTAIGVPDNPKIEQIEQNLRRIQNIVKSMRSLSRVSTPNERQQVSVSELTSQLSHLVSTKVAMVSADFTVTGEDFVMTINVTQILQVLCNLVFNSCDAVADATVRRIHVSFEKEGQEVSIVVQDTGSGIPNALREKILKPFFTTKEVGQGTGLGLSLSRTIAENHGGMLRILEARNGAKIELRLPLDGGSLYRQKVA